MKTWPGNWRRCGANCRRIKSAGTASCRSGSRTGMLPTTITATCRRCSRFIRAGRSTRATRGFTTPRGASWSGGGTGARAGVLPGAWPCGREPATANRLSSSFRACCSAAPCRTSSTSAALFRLTGILAPAPRWRKCCSKATSRLTPARRFRLAFWICCLRCPALGETARFQACAPATASRWIWNGRTGGSRRPSCAPTLAVR